jgi:hypothetical protein
MGRKNTNPALATRGSAKASFEQNRPADVNRPIPAVQAVGTAPTRKCSHCGAQFTLGTRRGRNSDKRHAKAARSYHDGARYCSDTCRKLASKARRGSLQPSPVGAEKKAVDAKKRPRGTNVRLIVAHAENSTVRSITYDAAKTGRGSPKKPVLDPRIVADSKWPGMYRARRPDGSLCDMVNLMRAKDAFAELWRRR